MNSKIYSSQIKALLITISMFSLQGCGPIQTPYDYDTTINQSYNRSSVSSSSIQNTTVYSNTSYHLERDYADLMRNNEEQKRAYQKVKNAQERKRLKKILDEQNKLL